MKMPDNVYEDMIDFLRGEFIRFAKDKPEDAKKFIEMDRIELVVFHHTLGRKLRNEFGLWEYEWEPEIDEDGIDMSPNHPDAISMRAIEELWESVQPGNQ